MRWAERRNVLLLLNVHLCCVWRCFSNVSSAKKNENWSPTSLQDRDGDMVEGCLVTHVSCMGVS